MDDETSKKISEEIERIMKNVRPGIDSLIKATEKSTATVKSIAEPLLEYVEIYRNNINKHSKIIEVFIQSQYLILSNFTGNQQCVIDVALISDSNYSNLKVDDYLTRNMDKILNDSKGLLTTEKQHQMFDDSIKLLNSELYEPCVILLLVLIENLINEITQYKHSKLGSSLGDIAKRLKSNNGYPSMKDISKFTIIKSLDISLEILYKNYNFKIDPEPKNISRHYILHGRSVSNKSKIDCLKIYSIIYGLLVTS